MSRAAWALSGGVAAICAAVAAVDSVWNPWFNDLAALASVPGVAALGLAERGRRGPALLTSLAALGWLATAQAPTTPAAARMLVMGIDGATFDVIDAEELPALHALAREGTRGTLRATEPMFSPLLWTTIASGRPPEDHGIRGFRVHADACRVARFWDVVEASGLRVGLWKWLVDYPPREVPGFWVPSWLAPGPETWPEALSPVKELELSRRTRRRQVETRHGTAALGWGLVREGLRLSTALRALSWLAWAPLADTPTTEVTQQLIRGRIDRDVFVAQLHRLSPDVATFTYYGVDALGHLYWDRHEAGGDEVRAAYAQADAILGELRGELGPDARVVVVSDHGFRAMRGASGANGPAGRFTPRTERLRARLTSALGHPVDVTRVGHKLTVATSTEQRQAARAAIEGWRDARGAAAFRVEDTPAGTLGLTLTDELVDAERLARDTVGGEPFADYVALDVAFTGTHEARGVFLAAGPGVTAGAVLPEVRLLDVAPTVLAGLGLPASTEMPGASVIAGWEELPRVEDHDHLLAGFRWLHAEEGVDEARLKALGYVE